MPAQQVHPPEPADDDTFEQAEKGNAPRPVDEIADHSEPVESPFGDIQDRNSSTDDADHRQDDTPSPSGFVHHRCEDRFGNGEGRVDAQGHQGEEEHEAEPCRVGQLGQCIRERDERQCRPAFRHILHGDGMAGLPGHERHAAQRGKNRQSGDKTGAKIGQADDGCIVVDVALAMEKAGVGDHHAAEGQAQREKRLSESKSPCGRLGQLGPVRIEVVGQTLDAALQRQAPHRQNQQHQPGQRDRQPDDLADQLNAPEYTEVHCDPCDNQRQEDIPADMAQGGTVDLAEVFIIEERLGVFDAFESFAGPRQLSPRDNALDAEPQETETIRQDHRIKRDNDES